MATRISLAAPSFVQVADSTHNDGSEACGAFVPPDPPSENKGDISNGKGGYIEELQVAQGAKIQRLNLFANDADMDFDIHLYLVRKRIEGGLDPQFAGYTVMAHTKSDGAVTNIMRKFGTGNIAVPGVDNQRFMYYLEMVVCANTVEPFAAQVGFTL